MGYEELVQAVGPDRVLVRSCFLARHEPDCARHLTEAERALHTALDMIGASHETQQAWIKTFRQPPKPRDGDYRARHIWQNKHLSKEICVGSGVAGRVLEMETGGRHGKMATVICNNCGRYVRQSNKVTLAARRHFALL